ncbi:hypothetical protein MTR_8g015670 [Medicago truncatula]|uniref:At1g61320/AtMIF1 LRR domain-containing protein n=1 Tax=Medicago truncatula TaxID=3880 RepID=G8A2T2_MEDTR|nr:hypothetical protein MTR_8g015670 [Medicago truncatula]
MVIFELPYMSMDVDHWLKLASQSGVEVLNLFLPNRGECYVLPNGVIEVKLLTKLVLVGGIRVDQAFMNHSIKFFSLRKLYFCIHGLLKLKTVDVQGIKEVHIDEAPSLANFNCDHGDWDTPFTFEFIRCRNLKGLCLFSWISTIITDKWFLDLFRKFPFLERLKLQNCKMSERINISSVQLKVLELSHCYNLKEVGIDAPNLLSCVYCGRGVSKPIISFLRSSSQLEVDVQIHLDYLEICSLGGFLQNIKSKNIFTSLSLFIFQLTMDASDPVVYQVSSPPPSVKRNFVFICCKYLTLNRAFIEFFYEITLMERKSSDCFCISCDTKCWWHGLKDVKVTSSMKIDENVDLKSFLEWLATFPNSDQEKISFILEF